MLELLEPALVTCLLSNQVITENVMTDSTRAATNDYFSLLVNLQIIFPVYHLVL